MIRRYVVRRGGRWLLDLLIGGDGKLLDFKASPCPQDSPELIAAYERQLCAYAHILDRRHGRREDRLFSVLDFGAAQGGCSHEPPVSL